MDDKLTTLSELLKELPGIGPRQARRLAYWFVRRKPAWVEEFSKTLLTARREVQYCSLCKRMFPSAHGTDTCSICSNHERDTAKLLVVEKDVDVENIERTGSYKGRYYVLGGTTSMLDKEPENKVRIKSLRTLLEQNDSPIEEVILALSATTHGEDTAVYVTEQIESILQKHKAKLSSLGRGLSTGTELEYVDRDTMRSALLGRQ